ncbi:MAG: substrate-binding domain-containing protein, partial [Chloroflexota bacterium]
MSFEDRLLNRRALLRGMAGGVLSVSAMGLLAACGGDDDDDDDDDDDQVDEPTATDEPADDPEPTATEEEEEEPTEEETEEEEEPTATEEEEPTATEEEEEDEDPTATEEEEDEEPTPSEEDEPTATEEAELSGTLVIYSGRSEELVQPIIDRFAEDTGLDVQVQYAGTSELAATLLEEGENSPADVFFAQDAGALGAVAREGLFAQIPSEHLDMVEDRFRSPDGQWIG